MSEALHLEQDNRRTLARVQQLDDTRPPDGDVTIAVERSTLNYKDALAITGRAPVVRRVAAWQCLATELDSATIARVADEEVSVAGAIELADELIGGRIKGPAIVNPNI